MEKKVKIKKMRDNTNRGKRFFSSLVFAIIALVIAGGSFIGLLYAQSYFSREVVYMDVACANETIKKGEIITEENISQYFTSKKIPSTSKTEGNITLEQVNELIGCKAIVTLYKGEEVTAKDFDKGNKYIDNIVDPVEVSIAVSSMESSDGGKIRAGDIVNITLMFSKSQLGGNNEAVVVTTPVAIPHIDADNETEEDEDDAYLPASSYVTNEGEVVSSYTINTKNYNSSYNYDSYSQYILENVYIKQVLNADGGVIAPTDIESTASVFIFIIPKDMELELNNALENCESMRVSKILYDSEETKDDVKQPTTEQTSNTAVEPVDAVNDNDIVYEQAEDTSVDTEAVSDNTTTVDTEE